MLFQARQEFLAARSQEMQAEITGVPLPPGSILTDDIFNSFLSFARYLKQGRRSIDDMKMEGRGAATPTTSTSIATYFVFKSMRLHFFSVLFFCSGFCFVRFSFGGFFLV
jgi:hypothetical protein